MLPAYLVCTAASPTGTRVFMDQVIRSHAWHGITGMMDVHSPLAKRQIGCRHAFSRLPRHCHISAKLDDIQQMVQHITWSAFQNLSASSAIVGNDCLAPKNTYISSSLTDSSPHQHSNKRVNTATAFDRACSHWARMLPPCTLENGECHQCSRCHHSISGRSPDSPTQYYFEQSRRGSNPSYRFEYVGSTNHLELQLGSTRAERQDILPGDTWLKIDATSQKYHFEGR